MKRILVAACLCGAVFNGVLADNADEQTAVAEAAVISLADSLKNELQAAMQSGGPGAAIKVCNTRAIPLTDKIASENGLQLARVSLRNRNPANAPNTWQTDVLEDFENRRSAGEDVNQIAWSETVDAGGIRTFRFMKAIPTGSVCLACHGTALSPEINQVLHELYPDDQATGFSEGDIRGAFVVTQTLAD